MKENQFFEKFEKFASKLGQQKHLLALRDGIILSMPLILVGSLFLIIGAFPIPAWENYLSTSGIGNIIWKVVDSTFGLMALVSVFGIARKLSEINKGDGVSAGVIALSSYILLIPLVDGGIKLSYFGSKGLFVAIIVGLVTGTIFPYLINKNITIKMPDSVPPAVSKSFASVIPGFIIVILFLSIDLLIKATGYNVFDVVLKLISEPLRNLTDSYFGTIFAIGLNSFIWMFGIHGGQLVGSIMDPVWLTNSDANRIAYQAGLELPHIVTQPFMNNFVWVGGSGAALGLVLYLVFFSKSQQFKALGKVAFAPDIFSVNEPMLFGIPIVLNFSLAIPFFLAPIATGTISYFATSLGLVAKTTGVIIPWATPPIISGYLSTGGSISGPILQVVNIFVAALIYLPFIKRLDNRKCEEENLLKEGEK